MKCSIGWENDEALGRRITYPEVGSMEVIGVVKDFHFQSLHQAIAPLLFFPLDAGVWGDQRVLAIKYMQRDQQELLVALEERWDRMSDDLPFDYSFYDTELARLYDNERRLSGLIALFTGLLLFIAILGLVY